MAQCSICNTESALISQELKVCRECLRETPERALPIALEAHRRSRAAFGLPQTPPREPGGLPCNLCVNECRIGKDETGYCGLRRAEGGRLTGLSSKEGKLSWYHDPLPTNCVADWVCPGGTGAGYPLFACSSGPEAGWRNLAVFFQACSFNCLYCQNWNFKRETLKSGTTSLEEFLLGIDRKTSCICYFGGDPSCQLPFALQASRLVLERNKGRILRICWETNGSMHPLLLDKMIELSLPSGGCIKFDLKAWDENIHIALTGTGNRRTLQNFSRAGEALKMRPVPPLLVASTLLVPGYIDGTEVRRIAGFIASVNPDIPYSLLAFYPHFYLREMPLTTKAFALACRRAAREQGLKNVRIGNAHLLA